MAAKRVSISEFLQLRNHHPVLDVRSPGEYAHAHIPGAFAFPLFTDEERKVVGTAYKQESREKAIKIGLKYFGSRMVQMVEDAEKLCSEFYHSDHNKTLLVHCWRGGMRSGAVTWLLTLYGFDIVTLAGGYKAFRHWVAQQFEKEYNFNVVGGFTGTGKTNVLSALTEKNEQVLDLEQLAHHRGSAFGSLGMPGQPTQEMFENKLALALQQLNAGDPTWIEDESQRIGNVNTPTVLFKQLRTKPVYFVELSFENRLENIVRDYGVFDKPLLEDAINRISKRLGGLETKNAIAHLHEGSVKECFRILLSYYDKWYLKSLQLRPDWQTLVKTIPVDTADPAAIATKLIENKNE